MNTKSNHKDSRHNEGASSQKGLPLNYKSRRPDEVAQLALERLLEAPDKRREELRNEYKERKASDLINPLREDRSAQAAQPTVAFQKALATMMEADGRAPVYRQLINAIDPKVAQYSHPPVVYLALAGGDAERFIGLLPWVRDSVRRREGIEPSVEGARLEARVWGVDRPTEDQIGAFIQTYSRVAEHNASYSELLPRTEMALIQKSGVLQVEAPLHKATKMLESVNPPAIWANHPEKMGAREAGAKYVQAVEQLIPPLWREVAANLAAIAWNRDRMGQFTASATGPALTPRDLVGITLRTAIVNIVGVNALRGLDKDVIVCADPRQQPQAVKTSFLRIMSELGFDSESNKDSPHRRFLKTVLQHSRSARSGANLLATAWREISSEFGTNALRDLNWIETSVLQFAKPVAPQLRSADDANGREILANALGQYERATLGSLPLRVLGSKGVVRASQHGGRGLPKIGPKKIGELLHLSEILAGIPWTEKQKLREVP